MKTRHTVFCSIGLAVGGLAGVLLVMSFFSSVFGHNYRAQVHAGSFLLETICNIALVVCLGGGGFSNLIAGRLKPGATTAMIVMYCLTCVLAPLGIWGIYELQQAKGRRRKMDRIYRDAPSAQTQRQKPSFAPKAAMLSMICSAGGFFAVILAGASHVRPIILLTMAIVTLGMLVSLACGVYALFCVREQGKARILLPALVGIAISGFFVLFLVVAMVAGGLGAMKAGQARRAAMESGTPMQTNAVQTTP